MLESHSSDLITYAISARYRFLKGAERVVNALVLMEELPNYCRERIAVKELVCFPVA